MIGMIESKLTNQPFESWYQAGIHQRQGLSQKEKALKGEKSKV